MRKLLFAAVTVLLSCRPAAAEGSYFTHNGSQMVGIVEKGSFSIYYHVPRKGLEAYGVTAGTLLFRGTVDQGQIKGTAFAFAKGCRPTPCEVAGRER